MGNPTVTPIVERRHAFGFLVYDPSDGALSREQVTIAAGSGIVTAGMVLAAAGPTVATAAPIGTNTGNPTFGVINATTAAGSYAVQMTDGTHFEVEGPNGVETGHGTLGQPYAAGGLSFTLTAGATGCVAGDSFAITVPPGPYVPFDPTLPGHTSTKLAILGSEYKDATLVAKQAAAVTRGPVKVNSSELVWGANALAAPASITAALAQLDSQGVRSVGGV